MWQPAGSRRLRREAAARFARDVERELADLGMEQARLDVRLRGASSGRAGPTP